MTFDENIPTAPFISIMYREHAKYINDNVKEEELRHHDGVSSDGYLAHIFRHAGKELFSEDVGEVTYHALRNKDFQEVTLEKSREVFLHFAAAYGF